MSLEEEKEIDHVSDDQSELVGFFDLLLKIDKRVNPSEYDARHNSPDN